MSIEKFAQRIKSEFQEEARELILNRILHDYRKQQQAKVCIIDLSDCIGWYERAGGESFATELRNHLLLDYYIQFTYIEPNPESHKKAILYFEIEHLYLYDD